MSKFKLIDDVSVVYYAETIQGKVDFDGEIIEFRYYEDSNGAKNWILLDGKWQLEFDEKYESISLACGSIQLSKDSKAGEVFDTDDYDDEI